MKKTTVNITIAGNRKAKLSGDAEVIRVVLEAFVRGAAEQHIDQMELAGRSREEVVASMLNRIHIANRHYELGESDGFKCDLSDA